MISTEVFYRYIKLKLHSSVHISVMNFPSNHNDVACSLKETWTMPYLFIRKSYLALAWNFLALKLSIRYMKKF